MGKARWIEKEKWKVTPRFLGEKIELVLPFSGRTKEHVFCGYIELWT